MKSNLSWITKELDLTYPGIITGLSGSNFNKTDSVCGGVATTVLIVFIRDSAKFFCC